MSLLKRTRMKQSYGGQKFDERGGFGHSEPAARPEHYTMTIYFSRMNTN